MSLTGNIPKHTIRRDHLVPGGRLGLGERRLGAHDHIHRELELAPCSGLGVFRGSLDCFGGCFEIFWEGCLGDGFFDALTRMLACPLC